jgi:hypothetical protein
MPSIVVEVDGARIATINLDGMQVVDVSVHGGLDGENKATLSATGGNYADGACGHVIWIAERPLQAGEVVVVTLDENCDLADHGQTMNELYPDEAPRTRTDFTISDEMAAEIRARPQLHDRFIVQAETSSGERVTALSDELNTNFRFGLLWDWLHPDRARTWLTTYCFEDVLARTGRAKHLETSLVLGEHASFSLVR